MQLIKSPTSDDFLDIEAEILRQIWYEGKANPASLSIVLEQDPNIVHACLNDLIERACVYLFYESPDDEDLSIYCLTKRAHNRLQLALRGFGRYRLRSFWMSFNKEDVVWLSNFSHGV